MEERKINLKNLLTMKLEGKVNVVLIRNLNELKKALKKSNRPFLIGGGSNTVINPLTKRTLIKLSGEFNFIKKTKDGITAGGACPLTAAVKYGVDEGDINYSYLALIPGSIGGALKGAAGSKYGSIFDIVRTVKILTPDMKVKTLKKEKIKHGYRKTDIKGIILEAVLNLKKGNAAKAKKFYNAILKEKKETQDYGRPSAGCVFKNPRHAPAGYLIEKAGLKGRRLGGFEISKKHANFIINKGGGAFSGFTAFTAAVKKEIKAKFNVNLALEVEVIK